MTLCYRLFGIKSPCSSASTSTVSSFAASAGTEVFHGQMLLQFANRINRLESVGSKYPLKQRNESIIKTTSVNNGSDASMKGCGAYCRGHKTSSKEGAYKCFSNDCSKVCNINFYPVESFSKPI